MQKPVLMLILLLCNAGWQAASAFAPKPIGPVSIALTVTPVSDPQGHERILDVVVTAHSSLDLGAVKVQVPLSPSTFKLSGSHEWEGALLAGQSRQLSFRLAVTLLPTELTAELFLLRDGQTQLMAQDVFKDSSESTLQAPRQVLSLDDDSLEVKNSKRPLANASQGVTLPTSSTGNVAGNAVARRIVEYRLD